ncbi:MAG: 4-hydroxy-tetrahydrodipicolinate synthase [Flavobacteriales bacterium]|jgi:4-hydroxy-tetrahydrodipicolinate synthase
MTQFTGLGVAMVTPFTDDHKIDYAGLKKLTTHLIEGGADYLVVQGTTGESPVLTKDEKRSVLDFVLEVNQGRKPVVFGIGGNNTAEVCETLESFDATGVAGILSASPSYNKPTQEGIYEHYKVLSKASSLPIILYNVPGRTGSNMSAETTLRLARDFKNIVAIKEASGNLAQIEDILEGCPADFNVISGDDGLTLAMLALGVEGLISVVGNAFPKEYADMVHKGMFGAFHDARPIHFRFRKLIDLLFIEGNPGGVKEVLKHLGICGNSVRLPSMPVSEKTSQLIYREMAERELVKV